MYKIDQKHTNKKIINKIIKAIIIWMIYASISILSIRADSNISVVFIGLAFLLGLPWSIPLFSNISPGLMEHLSFIGFKGEWAPVGIVVTASALIGFLINIILLILLKYFYSKFDK